MQISATNLRVMLGERTILNGLDFTLQQGELVGLIGRNGAGKSTLLKTLAGLLPLRSGSVSVDGISLDSLSRQSHARLIAYLPQSGPAHWNLTVEALVDLGRLPHQGSVSGNASQNQEAVTDVLHQTGLENMRTRPVDTLSGGERMRVLLARALAVRAPILLADEPIAALDPLHQLQTLELLRKTAQSGGITVAIMHDLTLASRFCDRLILLNEGTILADGAVNMVLNDANIAAAYDVSVYRSEYEGVSLVMPWKPI